MIHGMSARRVPSCSRVVVGPVATRPSDDPGQLAGLALGEHLRLMSDAIWSRCASAPGIGRYPTSSTPEMYTRSFSSRRRTKIVSTAACA